jgi:hypothetical protein
VRVDPTDTHCEQPMLLDESKHFLFGHGWSLCKQLQTRKEGCAIRKIAAGKFTDDERMHQDLVIVQQLDQPIVLLSQVIDPQ